MEQRTGPFTPPVHAVGNDPAFIPGLMSSSSSEPLPEAEEGVPKQAAAAAEEPPADASVPSVPADAVEEWPAVPDDGPVFEAADHRGAIIADQGGIILRLDGEEARFRWDEIGAVEIVTTRFSRWFTIRVYVSSRRWYDGDVIASSRQRVKEWTAALDAVLDARFEEHADPEGADGADDPETAEGSAGSGGVEEPGSITKP
ncbi:hypothetical protein ACFYYH_07210 [Streptomyces sp. NPDC002018]|uniref:hypothetical protein n=1 Tax=Streptomyces sp. NPDC002018 TaxID=3364629 RepID=UPI0036743D76